MILHYLFFHISVLHEFCFFFKTEIAVNSKLLCPVPPTDIFRFTSIVVDECVLIY